MSVRHSCVRPRRCGGLCAGADLLTGQGGFDLAGCHYRAATFPSPESTAPPPYRRRRNAS
eukprot:825447-Prorocentrum_minimum.AAC.1